MLGGGFGTRGEMRLVASQVAAQSWLFSVLGKRLAMATPRGVTSRHAAFWRDALQHSASWTSYSWRTVRANWTSGVLPTAWRPVTAHTNGTDVASSSLPAFFLLDVHCRVMIFPVLNPVLTSDPPALLDLAGGCCRPPAPLALAAFKRLHASAMSPARVLAAAEDAIEHEWLFMCVFSHSESYFHSLGEAGPKLMWGLHMLRANPTMRILHASVFVEAMLPLLGLTGRGVRVANAKDAVFARRLTIPPDAPMATPVFGHGSPQPLTPITLLRQELLAGLQYVVPPTAATSHEQQQKQMATPRPRGSLHVLVVRRSAVERNGGRAMLNHDEMMLVLRQIVLPPTATISEFPPSADLKTAAAMWSDADVAIVPHGAGTTNILFMRPNSTVVEIIRRGQTGRVYGGLAKALGHTYHACTYQLGGEGTLRSSLPRNGSRWHPERNGSTAFALDMAFFLHKCVGAAAALAGARGGGARGAGGRALRLAHAGGAWDS